MEAVVSSSDTDVTVIRPDNGDIENKGIPAETEILNLTLGADVSKIGCTTSSDESQLGEEGGDIAAANDSKCDASFALESAAVKKLTNPIEESNYGPDLGDNTLESGDLINLDKPPEASVPEVKGDFNDAIDNQEQGAIQAADKDVADTNVDDDLPSNPSLEVVNPREDGSSAVRPPLFDDGDDEVSIRSAVRTFYKKYNPDKLNTIDNILQQYLGFEIQLVLHLIQKYNAVDKSDLDIFLGSLNEIDLQEIAGYQLQIRKENSASNPMGADDAINDYDKEKNKEAIASAVRKSHNPESSKGVRNGHAGTAKQSLIASNIQDISSNIAGRFLNGWNTATSVSVPSSVAKQNHTSNPPSSSLISNRKDESNHTVHPGAPPSATSVADELLIMTRLNSLQAEVQNLEVGKTHLTGNIRILKAQVASLKRENTVLSTELTDGAQRQETTQKNLVSTLEREKKLMKEKLSFSEQLEVAVKCRADAQEKLEFESKLRENKHSQLLRSIQLVQRLEAQVRYLAGMTFDLLDADTAINYDEIDPAEHLEGDGKIDNPVGSEEADAIAERTAQCEAENKMLRWRLKVAETSYQASRKELSLATQQSAGTDQRVLEQQAVIQTLQNRLSGISTDLEMASGSADSLKKQINESNSELMRYRLMLAVSERNLVEKRSELFESLEEISLLKESLSVSSEAKTDLHLLCAELSRESETAAADYICVYSNRMSLEREEFLSRYSKVKSLEEEAKTLGALEAQSEMQRLREELFKCRRSETQKERENVFLQKQLVAAAETIALIRGKS